MIYFSSYAKSRVNPRQQHWFALRGKIFEIVDKSCLLFYLSTDGNIKILQYYIFFSIYCINMLTDGYNRWQFFIFMHKVSFSFSTFLQFWHPNYVFPKLECRPQVNSRSALDRSPQNGNFCRR